MATQWRRTPARTRPAVEACAAARDDMAAKPRFRDLQHPRTGVRLGFVDIDRGGPTYTIDTLRDLKQLLPDADLYFITGADALGEIFTWRAAGELFELAHFVGCTRPGYAMDQSSLTGMPHDRVAIVEIPALAISSTDCRQRQADGEPIWYLVPDGVVQYIHKYDLYATTRTEPTLGTP